MSPSYWTLHPFALFWQSSPCGLGGPTDPTGPCTGGYGPSGSAGQDASAIGQGAVSLFGTGHGMLLAIGLSLVTLWAILFLLKQSKRAAKAKAKGEGKKAPVDLEEDCDRCGADVAGEFRGQVLCESCLADARNEALAGEIVDLEEGEGLCLKCGMHYDVDEGGCPVCGSWEDDDAPSADSSEPACDDGETPDDAAEAVEEAECPGCRNSVRASSMVDGLCESCAYSLSDVGAAEGLEPCSVCGELFHPSEMEGDLFPACHACATATEADARRREIDVDGPDDEETFHGNPDGIGAEDEGVRA